MSTATTPDTHSAPPASDDLGIDRAFLMQMARIPFFALGWILVAFLAHQLWAVVSPTHSYSSVVVVCVGMVLAAVIDGWAFKVPNWLTLSLVLSGWGLGLLHTLNVPVDAGNGGIGIALLCTAIGFALLFPLLAIVGMGQGDVKMLMGFGAWVGAYFGKDDAIEILLYSFCLGAVVGGVCGIVMMVLRRKFRKNLSNFREIAVDLKVLATVGPSAAAARSQARRPGWDRLPYGIPLCIGFLGYLAYLALNGSLPGMQQ
jgi:prepilin peptidase CpaA